MNDTDKKECCSLTCKTNWAFALSIISVVLNIILITALIVGINCQRKKHHGFGDGRFGGYAGMRCPMMGQADGERGCREFGFEHRGGMGMENRGERMLARFSDALSLDAGQQAKVKQIFEDQKSKIEKLGDQRTPDAVKKIMEDGKVQIRAVLKPDQQKKFDDMMARFCPQRNQ